MEGKKLTWTIHSINENVKIQDNFKDIGHITSQGFLSNKSKAELNGRRYVFKTNSFVLEKLMIFDHSELTQLAEIHFNLLSSKAELIYKNEKYIYTNPSFSSHASWEKNGETLIRYNNKLSAGELTSYMESTELEAILIMAGIQTRKQFIAWIIIIIMFIWIFFF